MKLKDAVKYINRMRFGYLQELENEIGTKNLNLLKDAGFLFIGVGCFNNQIQNTWRITKMAQDYCKAMYGGVISRM